MKDIYIASDNIISSLGFTTQENSENIEKGVSGISLIDKPEFVSGKFYASLIDSHRLESEFSEKEDIKAYTRFEQMCILSVMDAISKTDINIKDNNTLFILSTTKGNIDILNADVDRKNPAKSLFLWETANRIAQYFKNQVRPLVVSNACISGIVALNTACRLIRAGVFENAVVTGADILSNFVVSGFQSFQSLSNGPCRPYDKSRDGLSLGEGCGTIILTADREKSSQPAIRIGGGFTSNDANHISGPSRTGEGLLLAIKKTLSDPLSSVVDHVDYISAHGTATPYNDEMEAIALSRAGLAEIPVNSLKGYWGHTLGAAGIIESVAALESMRKNKLYKTAGYKDHGVSEKINVIIENKNHSINSCLKTASGFGGCNAGILFYKV